MRSQEREIEIAAKLVRLDAKRRKALTTYGDLIRFDFKWAAPEDHLESILRNVANKIGSLWDPRLALELQITGWSAHAEKYVPVLTRLASLAYGEMLRETSALPICEVVEYLELLATPAALPVEVATLTVNSGLAGLLIKRTVAAAAALDRECDDISPYSLRLSGGLNWHPAPQAGIQDHAPWVAGLAQLHGCLAGWDAAWTLPPRPPLTADVGPRCAYFAPLALLMFGCLSWMNPALGIARWINSGMPTEDPALRLIKRHWGKWALAPAIGHDTCSFWTYGAGREISLGLTKNQTNLEETVKAGRAYLSSSEYGRRQLEFAGQLHMQTHIQWQLLGDGNVDQNYTVLKNERHAVILLGKYSGWWSILQIEGDRLQRERPDEDLKVKVVSPGVGLLGEFRRSPVTERWHVATHEAHLLGWTAE
ncbi:hypothetical protein AB4Y87_00495 [Paenarthrobacter sp. RAF54_2]|uniref:hypothetical protein n=1 Tax=Paenarthrobacter sp. RAF54_2 TaxID=3233061 RepID=UPI003F98019F